MDELLDSLREELADEADDVLKLGQLLTVAIPIDRRLLRNVRLKFLPLSDAGLEARFWFSSLIATRSIDTLTMEANVAYMLGGRLLETDPERFRSAWEFIREQHRYLPSLIQVQEELRHAFIRGNDTRELVARVLRTLHELSDVEERRELGRILKLTLAQMPNVERVRPGVQWLATTAAIDLGDLPDRVLGVTDAVSPAPAWLIRKPSLPLHHAIGLRLSPGLLEVSEAGEAEVILRLVDPPPAPLFIVFGAGGSGASRWFLAQPGRRLALDPPDCREVTIITPDGRRARVWAERSISAAEGAEIEESDSVAPAASVFICYRRADSSDTTDRIHDWLDREFPGAVFRDVDAIPFGVDFRQYIRQVLGTCRIMLVVIGPEWLTVTSGSGGRRIDDPRDHVRIEIETALAREDVLVIPLLVREATFPSREDLPTTIEALAYRTGPSIRRNPDFKHDMDRLIGQMRRALSPAPGEPWENSLGMRFVPVPGTEVLFSVWETRVRDFEVFVEATGYDATGDVYTLGSDGWKRRGGSWKSPGFDQTGEHPVVCVSWEDAQAFCKWLTDKEREAGRIRTGQEYRLPTDHEWSCAAGIGDRENPDQTPEEKDEKIQDIYPWGKDYWPPPTGAGNYAGSDAKPVGSFDRNRLGIYDLSGNVWEWCEDKYNPSDTRRVLLRGGVLWYSRDGPDALLGSPNRRGDDPGLRGDFYGFRCVVVVESSR